MEASDYIGKFILLFKHGRDKRPIYIEPELFKVTGVRGTRQLFLSAPDGSPASQGFTRLGEHIAATFNAWEDGQSALARLKQTISQVEQCEINFTSSLSDNHRQLVKNTPEAQ